MTLNERAILTCITNLQDQLAAQRSQIEVLALALMRCEAAALEMRSGLASLAERLAALEDQPEAATPSAPPEPGVEGRAA